MLWLGLVFFILLSLLFVWVVVIDYLPEDQSPPPGESEFLAELREQGVLVSGLEEMLEEVREMNARPPPDHFKNAIAFISALLLFRWPIGPIFKELRSR